MLEKISFNIPKLNQSNALQSRDDCLTAKLIKELANTFKLKAFRPNQLEIMNAILIYYLMDSLIELNK